MDTVRERAFAANSSSDAPDLVLAGLVVGWSLGQLWPQAVWLVGVLLGF